MTTDTCISTHFNVGSDTLISLIPQHLTFMLCYFIKLISATMKIILMPTIIYVVVFKAEILITLTKE